MKADLIIPLAVKDYNKIGYVINSVREFVTDVKDIHIITPNVIRMAGHNVFQHLDSDVLPYDRSEIEYRPSWVFQQMLKIFQNVTKNDWFLVMDADIFVNKKLPLFENGTPILYLGREQYHRHYFEFNKIMMGIEKPYQHSFISEFTLYNKKVVRDMLDFMNLTLDEFWDKSVKTINDGCYPGDAELYGSYVYAQQPNLYKIKQLTTHLGGKYKSYVYSNAEIEAAIKDVRKHSPNVDIMSLHSWES